MMTMAYLRGVKVEFTPHNLFFGTGKMSGTFYTTTHKICKFNMLYYYTKKLVLQLFSQTHTLFVDRLNVTILLQFV